MPSALDLFSAQPLPSRPAPSPGETQNRASHPATSAWVAASAGTGKTKLLTDRLLRLLLAGTEPQKILCLTYTKAAAGEMKNRLRARLSGWAVADDAMLKESLATLDSPADAATLACARRLFAEVLDSPGGGLNIQTIHSFCQSLLDRFRVEAGLAPHSELLEDHAARALLFEASRRFLGQLLDQPETPAAQALRELTEHKFTALTEVIIKESQQFRALFEQYETLEAAIAATYHSLSVDPAVTEEELLEAFTASTGMAEAASQLQAGSATDIKRGLAIAAWLRGEATIEEYMGVFLKKEDRNPRDTLATKKLAERLPGLQELLSREQQRIVDLEMRLREIRTAHRSADMLRLAYPLLTLYQRLKEQRGLLDYEDLIRYTVTLLERAEMTPWVLYKLEGGIQHILVDEAQDTAPALWRIIHSLSQEFFAGGNEDSVPRTLFVVGDEKQSIYSFQGADPHTFYTMQGQFAGRITRAGYAWENVTLDTSFRSSEPVLALVDELFSQEAIRRSVTFSPAAVQHKVHRNHHPGKVEVWEQIAGEEKEELLPWELPLAYKEAHNQKALVAERIAKTISEWLTSKRPLPGRGRVVQPGDILILLRSRGDLMELLVRQLKRHQVPVAGVDRLALTKHIAVMDVLALGQFLLLPQDDLTLATVLKTPLLGFTEEELFTLAYGRGNMTLWMALASKRDQSPVFQSAYDYLSALLAKVDYVSPYELYAQLLLAEGGRVKFAERLGMEAYDPLDEFLGMALLYEDAYTPSLQGFLDWMAKDTAQVKRDMEQAGNEVRIMTVHGAKGLQAPIVFLPDTVHAPKADSGQNIMWSEEGLAYWAPPKAEMPELLLKLREAELKQDDDEHFRLLYVALTRAEDELYVLGWKPAKNTRKNLLTWHQAVYEALIRLPDTKAVKEVEGMIWRNEKLPAAKEIVAPISLLAATAARLPAFLTAPPLPEAAALPLVAPSHSEEDEGIITAARAARLYTRGKLIHALLQHLPVLPPAEQQAEGEAFLRQAGASKEMLEGVMKLLTHPEYAKFFGANSRAEVAVVGKIDGTAIAGRIDRLVVEDDSIIIIDYKTNRKPPATLDQVPAHYRKQLDYYRTALQQIYPQKAVRCVLIWTETLGVMDW